MLQSRKQNKMFLSNCLGQKMVNLINKSRAKFPDSPISCFHKIVYLDNISSKIWCQICTYFYILRASLQIRTNRQ